MHVLDSRLGISESSHKQNKNKNKTNKKSFISLFIYQYLSFICLCILSLFLLFSVIENAPLHSIKLDLRINANFYI